MTEQLESIGSDVQAALEAGKQLAIKPTEINGTPVLIAPDNYQVEIFEKLREHPKRINQCTRFTTLKSFIEYFNAYNNEYSTIYIDKESKKFTGIIDHHDPITPKWQDHTIIFLPTQTPEWTNWQNYNKKRFSQEAFGEFIEDNLEEIIEPTGAEMLQIALNFQAKKNTKFKKCVRLDNGQIQLQYEELIDGSAGPKGEFKIPDEFIIALPIYEGQSPYKLSCKLRYRINEGNLSLWYEIIRPHKTIQANFDEMQEYIEKNRTQGFIYHGQP